MVPLAQPIIADGLGHYDFYVFPGIYTVVVVNFGQVQEVYPDQSTFGFQTTNSLTAGPGISIVGLVISAVGFVQLNPVADQSIISKSLLPATSNPSSQSLGNPGALWDGYFADLSVNVLTLAGPYSTTTQLSQCAVTGSQGDFQGQAQISAGLYIESSVEIYNGVLQLLTNDGYIAQYDGGFGIFVQAGPRGAEAVTTSYSVVSNVLTVQSVNTFASGNIVYLTIPADPVLNGQIVTVLATGLSGTQFEATFVHANYSNSTPGEAVTNFLKASTTLNLPDLTGGTSTPAAGFLTGITAAGNATAVGHLLFYSSGGLLIDSNIGGNGDIVFFDTSHGVVFENGGSNSIFLYAPTNSAGAVNIAMPDVSGTLLAGIATAASATAGAIAPTDFVGFLEVNLPNGTVVKVPYYSV
jgi:hypothetical protein